MKFLERSELVTLATTLTALTTPGMMGFALAPIVSMAGGALLNLRKLI